MAHFNSVVVVGRLTGDPELRYAPSGAPVCTFSVATSRRVTKEDGRKAEATIVLEIAVWRRMAEICAQFLTRGREVLVMGELRQSRWTDPATQACRSKITVVAQQVQFLGKNDPSDVDAQDSGPEASGE